MEQKLLIAFTKNDDLLQNIEKYNKSSRTDQIDVSDVAKVLSRSDHAEQQTKYSGKVLMKLFLQRSGRDLGPRSSSWFKDKKLCILKCFH